MSNVNVRFYSNCLKRYTSFQVYLPYDERADFQGEKNKYQKAKTRVLFLLHGYTGDAGNWVPEYLADKYNFAIVIPNGENSFWIDGISTGHEFGKFLGEELLGFVQKTFGLATTREETFIMGLSMGGYGALRTALAYPEKFSKTAGLSSALIVKEVAKMEEGQGNPVANYEYYRECFGDPKKVLESRNNPEFLVKEIKETGKVMPEIFMAVGTEDFLLENNRDLHKFLEEENVPHTYEEDKGNHDMDFWNRYVERYIPRMFEY